MVFSENYNFFCIFSIFIVLYLDEIVENFILKKFIKMFPT